jgi:hypothetical protein
VTHTPHPHTRTAPPMHVLRRYPLQGAMMGQLELVLQWIPMQQLRK